MKDNNAPDGGAHHLQRRFGLLQSTALNMSNMVGAGPFVAIPLLMSAMGGAAGAARMAGGDGNLPARRDDLE